MWTCRPWTVCFNVDGAEDVKPHQPSDLTAHFHHGTLNQILARMWGIRCLVFTRLSSCASEPVFQWDAVWPAVNQPWQGTSAVLLLKDVLFWSNTPAEYIKTRVFPFHIKDLWITVETSSRGTATLSELNCGLMLLVLTSGTEAAVIASFYSHEICKVELILFSFCWPQIPWIPTQRLTDCPWNTLV